MKTFQTVAFQPERVSAQGCCRDNPFRQARNNKVKRENNLVDGKSRII